MLYHRTVLNSFYANNRKLLIILRSSLWFVSGLMIISSNIPAFLLIEIDSSINING